ncbi:MAG TPA: FAD-dependent oxidoreductase [Micromonosporaceae bacterium]|nr:FAD-dependent oxidoreductase [Micromonosporaceae bacterium]
MSSRQVDALVVGAGVVGLTTAVRFAEAGLSVHMVAARPPRRTSSAAAGASWGPYMASDPRLLRWSDQARSVLEEIAKDPSSGVRLVSGVEAAFKPMEPPSWALTVRDLRLCRQDELPVGYRSGWRYTIPVVDMPRYLDYLANRLAAAGVGIEIRSIASFVELADHAPLLVNCTGLGARTLVPDDGVYPTQGQLVIVENPGIDMFFQDNAEGKDLTYILPHAGHVVLGGSAIAGSSNDVPDLATAAAIVERCATVAPRLRTARVLRHLVGLRPTRSAVRVEREAVNGVPLIHNYGHGGSGLTLSWGCADEVLALSGLTDG